MIAELVVIIIVLAAVAFQYLKGKLLNSFIMFACSIIAVVIAFNYFELAAGLLIKRDLMIEWAYPGSLILIFLVAFAIIYAVAERFISGEIYFKEIVDVIGRCLFGVLIGLAISGVIITAVAMMPIPSSWPYQRFASDGTLTDKFQTNKTLLSKADSFVAGLFSSVSAGSMSSQTSFAAVHPDFINELHLNRTFYIKDSQAESISGKIPLIAGSEAATIKKAWVPETKLSSSSKALPLPEDTKNKPVIVRLAINGKNINQGGALDTDGQVKFSIAQIKLLTKPKNQAQNLLGKSTAVCPAGYIKAPNVVEVKNPSDTIVLTRSELSAGSKQIDFVFYIPSADTPVLLNFKQRSIAKFPKLASDDIPDTLNYIQASDCATDKAVLTPVTSAKIYGLNLTSAKNLLDDFRLDIKRLEIYQNNAQDTTSITTQIRNNKISYTQAKLFREVQNYKNRAIFASLLVPPQKYQLLGLKCNRPQTGKNIPSSEFPVLKDFNGKIYKPVGALVEGSIDKKTVFQIDYCSLTQKEIDNGLPLGKNGIFEKAFPDSIWLTGEAEKINTLHFLYLIRKDKGTIITEVLPANSNKAGTFEKFSGFFVP